MTFRREQSIKSRSLGMVVTFLAVCLPVASAPAQVNVCVLSPDKRGANDRILRCGTALTVRPAPGTLYRQIDAESSRPPGAVQLDGGALLLEFHPTKQRRDFQILTPQAIAAVRGTIWAVEVKPGQSSVLVLRGAVQVARANSAAAVVLRRGQGVDVTDAGGPLEVKRWAPERVRTLLARFSR
jgi:hypothetical protein